MSCDVCSSAAAKYKCPRCRVPYCGVACYKEHKESAACEAAPKVVPEARVPTAAVATVVPPPLPPLSADVEGDLADLQLVVPAERLAQLRASDAIRAQLKDSRLQKVGGLRALEGCCACDLCSPPPRAAPLPTPAWQIITDIDTAPNRVEALHRAKLEDPRLAGFIDEVLLCVGACERQPDGTIQFVM